AWGRPGAGEGGEGQRRGKGAGRGKKGEKGKRNPKGVGGGVGGGGGGGKEGGGGGAGGWGRSPSHRGRCSYRGGVAGCLVFCGRLGPGQIGGVRVRTGAVLLQVERQVPGGGMGLIWRMAGAGSQRGRTCGGGPRRGWCCYRIVVSL